MTNLEKLANKAMSRWPRKNIRDAIYGAVVNRSWVVAERGVLGLRQFKINLNREVPEPFIWGPGDLFDCKTGNYPKDTSPYSAEEE